ncbi:hypothetical protein [Nostoc sp.]|uniref:hypothetical protein n=1 Tax=Nostoc sp. TaxID=1180 RepID=UPI002FFC571C
MCNDFFIKNECTDYCDTRKTIVVRDSGNSQEYRVTNGSSKEFCKVRIDNCLIREGEKCDYLILNCQDKLAFFVELKGQDLKKALVQIDLSISILMHEIPDFKIYARIVLNRTPSPNINSSTEIKLKKRLKKHNGDDTRELVKYMSQVLQESI